jgi:hypothetical protein
MQFPKPKNEVNVNTIIQIVTLLMMIGGGGAVWGTTQAAIGTLTNNQGKTDIVVAGNTSQINRIPNLEYRLTVVEQANGNLATAVEQLREALSDQGADIKVMREILTRLDQQMTRNASGQ